MSLSHHWNCEWMVGLQVIFRTRMIYFLHISASYNTEQNQTNLDSSNSPECEPDMVWD